MDLKLLIIIVLYGKYNVIVVQNVGCREMNLLIQIVVLSARNVLDRKEVKICLLKVK